MRRSKGHSFIWASVLFLFAAVPAQGQEGVSEKIGPGVAEAVRARGAARVVVALVEPPALQKQATNLPALRAETARLQDAVLATLRAEDFEAALRFEAVPALAGTVRSAAGLAVLEAHPGVLRVDLDVGGGGGLDTSVPLVRANAWHDQGVTGAGVVVAVLDSGLDTDHDDLGDDLIHQACFLDFGGSGRCPNGNTRQLGTGAAEDDHGHGTNVTGIITAGGVRSSAGVAPDAEVVALKVLDGTNSFAFFSEIVAALDYLIANPQLGVRVINMSLGTNALFSGTCDNAASFTIAGSRAINTLRANGILAFASSMNNGNKGQMAVPACLRNVLAVGATDDFDSVAGFTNSNNALALMAPGVGIVSTGRGNSTSSFSGTSQAAPHAAGCAALLLEAGAAAMPDQLESILLDSPTAVTDPGNGGAFPRLDCFSSVAVGVEDAPTRPAGFALSEAYPNPFNPSTTFALTLTQPQHVRAEAFDVMGRRVAVLHDARLAPGRHTFRFAAEGLASGTYLIRMAGEQFTVSRAVLLAK